MTRKPLIFVAAGVFVIISFACTFATVRRVQQDGNLSSLKSLVDKKNTTITSLVNNFAGREATTLVYNATGMHAFVEDGFNGRFCPRMIGDNGVHVSFGCDDLFRNNHYGTGNFLMSIYILRSTAKAIGNVDVLVTCHDAQEQKGVLILPWLTGWFPHNDSGSLLDDVVNASHAKKCRTMKQRISSPLGERVADIQFELRKMAVALVGIPNREHPSHSFSQENLWKEQKEDTVLPVYGIRSPHKDEKPIVPDVILDDAVLHFRCGGKCTDVPLVTR
jgi:hypothetical protein